MCVILSSTGHLLVPDSVADAADIRAKITDYLPAQVVARDSEVRLAVLKVEGARNLRPVEMGTVDDLKEYAPYDFAMANGRTSRSFPTIVLVTPVVIREIVTLDKSPYSSVTLSERLKLTRQEMSLHSKSVQVNQNSAMRLSITMADCSDSALKMRSSTKVPRIAWAVRNMTFCQSIRFKQASNGWV